MFYTKGALFSVVLQTRTHDCWHGKRVQFSTVEDALMGNEVKWNPRNTDWNPVYSLFCCFTFHLFRLKIYAWHLSLLGSLLTHYQNYGGIVMEIVWRRDAGLQVLHIYRSHKKVRVLVNFQFSFYFHWNGWNLLWKRMVLCIGLTDPEVRVKNTEKLFTLEWTE